MGNISGLDGRVALITGASGALGRAALKVFADAGAIVSGCDKAGAAQMRFDVTDPDQALEAVDLVVRDHGRIDILLNLVGTWKPQPAVHEITDPAFDALMNVNFRSALNMSRAAMPVMYDGKWGRIINVGAKQGLQNTAKNSAYGVSKAAVISLTQSIAAEGHSRGVTCNAVVPSTMDTPANRASMPDSDFSKWVQPVHVAETMAFLCTDAGGNINGATLPVWNRA